MTRAKDISKILTDADLSGTLDVAGELQVGVDGTTAGLIRLMDSGSVTEEATISTDANGGLIFGTPGLLSMMFVVAALASISSAFVFLSLVLSQRKRELAI